MQSHSVVHSNSREAQGCGKCYILRAESTRPMKATTTEAYLGVPYRNIITTPIPIHNITIVHSIHSMASSSVLCAGGVQRFR